MARVVRRRAAREARHARTAGGRRRTAKSGRSRGSASSVESTLFFTRLRTQAKWAFALMVIVFGLGFAFLGVGSGGLDLGSIREDDAARALCLWVNSPSNPTGALDDLQAAAGWGRARAT